MDLTHLMEQVFKEYGLLGLLIVFVMMGPGFTWIKTRNLQVQVEDRARELVAEFAHREGQRADRLERQLNVTLGKLEKAEDEVTALKLQLQQAAQELEEMVVLRAQLQQLSGEVSHLQRQI